MTRKEQIRDAAEFYSKKNKKVPIPYLDFIEAAEWADRTMIEKVNNMLYAMLSTQEINDYDYVTAPAYDNIEDFIEDFCKAIEK